MIFQRYLIAGIVRLATFPVAAVEPVDGVITEPHDWDCAYAYSDTTCARMMQRWANDVNLEGEVSDYVACGDCDPVYKKGFEGTKYLVGYACSERDGYAIKTDDDDALVQVYRNGGTSQGWRVSDWTFDECLLVFECAEECGDSLSGYICFVDSGYSIGKWTPVLDESCRTTVSGGEDSEYGEDGLRNEDDYSGGYECP